MAFASICWQFNKQIITHDWPDLTHRIQSTPIQSATKEPTSQTTHKKTAKAHIQYMEIYVANAVKISAWIIQKVCV